ncbi:hypothetical protein CR513_60142, partial [Mucuna pruriens]
MESCNEAMTLVKANMKLIKNEVEKLLDETFIPDIRFGVSLISWFMSDPKGSHMVVVKRILRNKVWLFFLHVRRKSLPKKLKVGYKKPVQLFVDKKSSISLTMNPITHGRSKHTKTNFYFLKDQMIREN